MDVKTLGDVFQLVNASVQDERRKLAERLRAVTRWERTNYCETLEKCKDGEFASGDELDDIIAELEGETGGDS